jgi:DNA-binding transcriptional ArsR family regulator
MIDQWVYMNEYTYEKYLILREQLPIKRSDAAMKKGLSETCYKFFSNLSNPTRLAAIEQLMKKPMSVNELAEVLGQEQSMVSHNLKPLLECNFVFLKRQGKQRIYSANKETIGALFRAVENHEKKFCPTGGKCQLRDT